jgi:6-phosphogluconolactonase
MNISIADNPDQLSHKATEWITLYIQKVISEKNQFTIALSGGNTPKKLYDLLTSEQFRHQIDWAKMHFFWGDERYVPFTHERNNARMAFETLLDKVPVLKEQIYIMRTDIPPEDSAAEYEKILREYFDQHSKHSFDLVLLGLGDNAHTLSLFPGYEVVREKKKWVTSFYLKEEQTFRITLTAPIVNNSGRVAFLVSGGDKAAALYHVLSGDHNPDLYPAQAIQPFNDELYWFTDKAAAADL